MKYPSTPYHPASPNKGSRDDRIHKRPERFVGVPIIITEKLDGSNTLISEAQVYGRSVMAPSQNKWMAMVKKHHSWKIRAPGLQVYGENLFGVHSIEYDSMTEEETFRVFAVRLDDKFLSFDDLEDFCKRLDLPIVPMLFNGIITESKEIDRIMSKPEGYSQLGSTREGMVMRIAASFVAANFNDNVCKSVRPDHVQTDEHWTRNWQPCKLKKRSGSPVYP